MKRTLPGFSLVLAVLLSGLAACAPASPPRTAAAPPAGEVKNLEERALLLLLVDRLALSEG